MFIKIRPLIFALVFFLGLEALVFFPEKVFWILSIILIFSFYIGAQIGKKWIFAIIPFFFALFSIALLYLISFWIEEQAFIFLSVLVYYLGLLGTNRLGLYAKDKTAQGMLVTASVSTIFFSYSSLYGLYLNFLVPAYFLMLAYLFVTLFVSFPYFSLINQDRKQVWLYTLILAFLMTELIWTMNFWPFGYLTTGVIGLILYYIFWDLIRSYFLHQLNKKKVITNLVFFFFLASLVLLTSKWIPLI